MERRTYIWNFTGDEETDTYAIIAYAGRYGRSKGGHYLPIKMQVKLCERDGCEVAPAELIYASIEEDKDLNPKFLRNRVSILQGKDSNWVLVGFEPMMTGIYLWYYSKSADEVEKIYLHACRRSSEKGTLRLQFEVPHASGKPNTWYQFTAECRTNRVVYNCILLESLSQDTQKSISFCLDESKHGLLDFDQCDIIYPDYADVTEYTDV